MIRSQQKWRKLEIRKFLHNNSTQVLVFNYICDDYKQLLRKLVALVPMFPTSLKFLIVYLPVGATAVDLYYSRRIQEIVART